MIEAFAQLLHDNAVATTQVSNRSLVFNCVEDGTCKATYHLEEYSKEPITVRYNHHMYQLSVSADGSHVVIWLITIGKPMELAKYELADPKSIDKLVKNAKELVPFLMPGGIRK